MPNEYFYFLNSFFVASFSQLLRVRRFSQLSPAATTSASAATTMATATLKLARVAHRRSFVVALTRRARIAFVLRVALAIESFVSSSSKVARLQQHKHSSEWSSKRAASRHDEERRARALVSASGDCRRRRCRRRRDRSADVDERVQNGATAASPNSLLLWRRSIYSIRQRERETRGHAPARSDRLDRRR